MQKVVGPAKSTLLPGLTDRSVNLVAADLLMRKADVNGDGKVSARALVPKIERKHRWLCLSVRG